MEEGLTKRYVNLRLFTPTDRMSFSLAVAKRCIPRRNTSTSRLIASDSVHGIWFYVLILLMQIVNIPIYCE